MKLVVCAIIVGFLGSGSSLGAEPAATVRQLMKEPMSIFDWGLFRLQSDLQENLKFDQTKEFQPSRAYVEYKSNTNQIVIGLFTFPKQSFLKDVPPKDICKNGTNYVRRFLDEGELNLAACCLTCNSLKWDYAPNGDDREARIADAARYVSDKRKEQEAFWNKYRSPVRR